MNAGHDTQRRGAVGVLSHALERVNARHAARVGRFEHAASRGEPWLAQ
jgi:hypothetical protein